MVRPYERLGKRWKRSDVTSGMLLHMIDKWGINALDMMAHVHGIPTKVLVAAVHRDTKRKLINWGITPWCPFLDVEGQRIVREAKGVRRINSQGGRGRGVGGAGMRRDQHQGAGGACHLDPAAGACGGAERDGEGSAESRRAVRMTTSRTYRVRFEECDTSGNESSVVVVGVQEVSGAPETVAAFLRALADQLDPPRPVTRIRDVVPEDARRERGMVSEPDRVQWSGGVLPRPTP